jgi:UDP:flavonoid glycosyltransferase YjiC (YdhE family)
LATCDALICTAGNQLVGEALFLQKPVLALPEPGNFEQALNGHFLRCSGGGESIPCSQLDAARLRQFVEEVPRLRSQIRPEGLNGNPQALRAIERFLPAAERSAGEPVVERAA